MTTIWWCLHGGSLKSLEGVPELSPDLYLLPLPWAGLGKGEFFKTKQTGITVLFGGDRKSSVPPLPWLPEGLSHDLRAGVPHPLFTASISPGTFLASSHTFGDSIPPLCPPATYTAMVGRKNSKSGLGTTPEP